MKCSSGQVSIMFHIFIIFIPYQAASQSMAITPEGDSRPRTAERHVNNNLFFTTRPKSSGGRFNNKEEGSSNHLKLPSHHHDDDGLLSPPGVVFQESRANSAMSLIDDPGKNF